MRRDATYRHRVKELRYGDERRLRERLGRHLPRLARKGVTDIFDKLTSSVWDLLQVSFHRLLEVLIRLERELLLLLLLLSLGITAFTLQRGTP